MKNPFKFLFKKCENPLVKDTFTNRYNEWLCGKKHKNCITVGSYYRMSQAWCSRCGHRNRCAGEGVPEWQLPDIND